MLISNYLKFSSCAFLTFLTLKKRSWTALIACSVLTWVPEHGWAAPVTGQLSQSWWGPSGGARPMEIGRSWWSPGPTHELSHFRTFQWIFLLLEIKNIFLVIMWKSRFKNSFTNSHDRRQTTNTQFISKFIFTCEAYRSTSQVLGLSVLMWHVTMSHAGPALTPANIFKLNETSENNTNSRGTRVHTRND